MAEVQKMNGLERGLAKTRCDAALTAVEPTASSAPRLWPKARNRARTVHPTGRLRAIEVPKRLLIKQFPAMTR